MKKLSPTAFQAKDKEVISVVARSTGAQTLFGVNYAMFGAGTPLKEGAPTQITMDKSKAKGNSTVPNAKSAPLDLVFTFNSATGGKYDFTISGDADGDTFNDFVRQAGTTPKDAKFTFHIV